MFKIFRKNCCGLNVHKTWIYACIGITYQNSLTSYKEARFPKGSGSLLTGFHLIPAQMCVWNQPESIGFPCLISWRKPAMLFWLIQNTPNRKKATRQIEMMPSGSVTLFMCDMIKPSFIPPVDIRQLRDLMRYRENLTNCITREKNRASNCLTVSNLKLDDVLSDVFGKSARPSSSDS